MSNNGLGHKGSNTVIISGAVQRTRFSVWHFKSCFRQCLPSSIHLFLLLLQSTTFPPYVSSPQLAEGNQWRCRSDPSPPPGHGALPASQSPPSAGTCRSHPAWHCRAVAAGPLALGGRRRSSGWEMFIKRESRDWHRKVEVFIRGWKWKRKERWRCGKVLM